MAERGQLGYFANDPVRFYNNAINEIIRGRRAHITTGLMGAIEKGLTAAVDELSREGKVIEKALRENVLNADTRREIHTEVGKKAQAAVLNSYVQKYKPGAKSEFGYRSGDAKWRRYSGGRLKAALASPKLWTANARDLWFINAEHLNKEAAQWARLNFGAGQAGTGSRTPQKITFGDQVVATIGLNEGPRPAFEIPAGAFFTKGVQVDQGGRGTSFFVRGTGPRQRGGEHDTTSDRGRKLKPTVNKPRMTRGIEAMNFLDAGVAVIARELPERYERAITGKAETTVSRTPQRPRLNVNYRPASGPVLR